ncbi:zinc-dependent peptidase [Hydrogenophaga sp. IBVHS2]|uniref:M90 family metallopeptidase n=1 Tax=Hydrogenophaga sp. IBVHS2 TaxID=1985170 RepID=UPI000A2E161B|nr:M90 family metallopeptidase [Hydrogenophaga sp. IBVHS2]OSZ65747.1 hypothetical protein CAP38_06765 [Hydrogenophaga sp. IBVHS2]
MSLLQRWMRRWRRPPAIPDALWASVLAELPFVTAPGQPDPARLRGLCAHFLAEKEFHGAHGLAVTDAMALSIAVQACLPLPHMHLPDGRPPRQPCDLLDWYADFVGIVVQPGAVLARREVKDATGVVHQYTEALAGEAMDGGPLMLSWEDVATAGEGAAQGHNVVIHEFVHKMDMHDIALGEHPGGSPPLPRGFLGHASGADARAHWQRVIKAAFERFTEAVSLAERFGGEPPWLDEYAAHSPAEFFAVTCEAYFVNRERFGTEFPELLPLYDGLFRINA